MPDYDAVGPTRYMAPELLRERQVIGPAADIFSTGITLLDLASGRVLPGHGDGWHHLRSDRVPRELFGNASDEFVELISAMVRSDPLKRPSTEQILSHPRVKLYAARYELNRTLWYPVGLVSSCLAAMLSTALRGVAVFRGRFWTPAADLNSRANPRLIGSSSEDDYDVDLSHDLELLDPLSPGTQTR